MQQPAQETSAQPEQDDFDIHVKTMDVGQYNTINLQAELAADFVKSSVRSQKKIPQK